MVKELSRIALTTQQIADALGYHPESIRREIRRGELQAASEQPYRVTVEELKRWWSEKGGTELYLPPPHGVDTPLSRFRNPVGPESVSDMARRIAKSMRTLALFAEDTDSEEYLPDSLETQADDLSEAADKIENELCGDED
ncbi:helix-turn-helix domain-containing protein [Salinibacter altiplanensis]|uniref:helix-turn-helix domain-containing protein n=1 Tax=Salinibacter altiplanensis TaxID=1803181 RepID=UPI001319D96A|nr:helix-turn-helix domain-containing protein [Salinibacter altiplanensis]